MYTSSYKYFCLVGCDAVYICIQEPTFHQHYHYEPYRGMKSVIFLDIMPCSPQKVSRRFKKISLSSSGLKSKLSKKPARRRQKERSLLVLLFIHEDEGNIFIRNVG
jgi:hypothetical protein